MIRRLVAPVAMVATFAVATTPMLAAQGSEPFPGLDAYITQAMASWKVPGLTLAIVRNDSIIYTKGYGVRSIEGRTPVDPHTLFAIGSDTKSFTAAAIAMLVTDGKMRYDDRVTQYLPDFQLYDPWVTREVTVRDLLIHRTGLGRGEALWYARNISRDKLLHDVRFLKPGFSFRYRFGYNNMMYMAAGQTAAAAAGTSYETLIHDRIFVPLGMTSSNTSTRALAGQSDVATPHVLVHDTVYTTPYRNVDDIGGAGIVNSNAVDMAQWVRFQLAGGVYNGKRLVGEKELAENHTPQIMIGGGGPTGTDSVTHFGDAYGMGWIISDYRRHRFWSHAGGIDGMTALVALLPEQRFGIVFLTNMNGTGITGPLMRWIFDHELGVTPVPDWNAQMSSVAARGRARADAAERSLAAKREPNTTPSLPLSAYTGTYSDSAYGDVVVTLVNGQLAVRRGEVHGPLQHWHHDVFQAQWTTRWIGSTFVTFTISPANTVDMLTMDFLGDHMVLRHVPPTTRR